MQTKSFPVTRLEQHLFLPLLPLDAITAFIKVKGAEIYSRSSEATRFLLDSKELTVPTSTMFSDYKLCVVQLVELLAETLETPILLLCESIALYVYPFDLADKVKLNIAFCRKARQEGWADSIKFIQSVEVTADGLLVKKTSS